MSNEASPATIVLFGFLCFVAVLVYYGVRSREEREALFGMVAAAFVVKAILVPLYYWILLVDGSGGFAYFDAIGYHDVAVEMSTEIREGLAYNSHGWSFKDPGYGVISALLYTVFGVSTLLARLFNVTVGLFAVLYVYRIGCITFDKGVGRTAAIFATWLPYTILVTINHRKEALVIFLATLIFYHMLRVVTQQPRWLNSLALVAVWLIPLYFVRGSSVLPLIGLFMVMLFMTQRSVVVGVLLSIVTMTAFVGVQLLLPDAEELSVQSNVAALDHLVTSQGSRSEQAGGLLRFAKVTSVFDIWKAPIGAFLLILMPYPPDIIALGQPIYVYLLGWSHVVFLLFLPQFFLGLREVFRAKEWKRRLPLVIYAGGILLVVGALSVGVMRYRETVFPAILVITAAGTKVRTNWLLIGAVYTVLFLLATVIYFNRYIR